MNFAVLASHEGTTLQAVLDACAEGRIPARVAAVLSNNSAAGALRRARLAGVPALHLSEGTAGGPAALDEAILGTLQAHAVDVVLLLGYMKRLGPQTLAGYAGRVLNTHPALLPKFGGRGMFGLNVHRAVVAAGETVSGASIHLVDGEYDTGKVIAQVSVPVEGTDSAETLGARVQAAERAMLVEVLTDIASGRRRLD